MSPKRPPIATPEALLAVLRRHGVSEFTQGPDGSLSVKFFHPLEPERMPEAAPTILTAEQATAALENPPPRPSRLGGVSAKDPLFDAVNS